MFKCPLHAGDDFNFGVNAETQTATCFSHACIEGGDIFQYIMMRENVSFVEAVKILEDKAPLSKLVRTPPVKKVEVPQEKYLSRLQSLIKNQPFAMKYLEERGINPDLAMIHWITVDDKYYSKSYGEDEVYRLEIKDDKGNVARVEERWVNCPRLTLPTFFFDKIAWVQSRRIDKYFEQHYQENTLWYLEILEDMAEKNPDKDLDMRRDVWDRLSKRYKMWPKPNLIPFNIHRVVTKKDGKFFYPEWATLLITEGELDALSFESAGYPAIGVRSVKDLPNVVSKKNNIKMLYIVAENDPIRFDPRTGLYVTSGDDWAERVKQASQHPNVTIIHPPEGCKDANDALKKGKMGSWLGKLGIKSIPPDIMLSPIKMAREVLS